MGTGLNDGQIRPFRLDPFLVVGIDIKPGEALPSINQRSQGTTPVAILSSPTFNAPGMVVPTSLTFGRTGNEHSLAFCNSVGDDVNGDGLPDLVCHFNTQEAAFGPGDTKGLMEGSTVDGKLFKGADAVRIIH